MKNHPESRNQISNHLMKMIKPSRLIGREMMITWNSLTMSEMLSKWASWKQNTLLFIIEWGTYQLKFQFIRHYLIIVCLNFKEYSCKEICKKNKKSSWNKDFSLIGTSNKFKNWKNSKVATMYLKFRKKKRMIL